MLLYVPKGNPKTSQFHQWQWKQNKENSSFLMNFVGCQKVFCWVFRRQNVIVGSFLIFWTFGRNSFSLAVTSKKFKKPRRLQRAVSEKKISGVNVFQYEFNETNCQIAFYSAFERLWTFSLLLWKRVEIKWIKNCEAKSLQCTTDYVSASVTTFLMGFLQKKLR